MSKTIKQIADELGVSKTAIRKKMTEEVKTKFSKTVSGIIYVDNQGEKLIKQGFIKDKPETKFSNISGNKFSHDSNKVSSEFLAIIEIIQKQLEVKDTQLYEKDKQISELTETIKTQAQSINAYQQKELAGKIIEGKQLIDNASSSENQKSQIKKNTIFSKIFGNKN